MTNVMLYLAVAAMMATSAVQPAQTKVAIEDYYNLVKFA